MEQVALEYAKALFSLACEAGEEEATMAALEQCSRVLKDTPEYVELMCAPSIPMCKRLALLEKGLGAHLTAYALSSLQLMCEKGHFRSFFACVAEYRRLLDGKKRVIFARVTSAIALNARQEDALRAALERQCGGAVTMECRVDASLLGGVIVEMNGRVMDGSLRHRLHKVKEVMNE